MRHRQARLSGERNELLDGVKNAAQRSDLVKAGCPVR
jgi:hypothetical protein